MWRGENEEAVWGMECPWDESGGSCWVLGEAGRLLRATQLLWRRWGSVCSNCPISSLARGPAALRGTGHLAFWWGDWCGMGVGGCMVEARVVQKSREMEWGTFLTL